MSVDPNSINIDDTRKRPSPKIRFFERVDMMVGGCWEWTGKKAGNGYGQLYYGGKHEYAHRIIWFWMYDEWPEAVMHKCDNPCCVNPSHLVAGSDSDNMKDCVNKGRHVSGFKDWPSKTDWRPPGRLDAERDEEGKFC